LALSPSIASGTSLNGLPSIRGISSFAFSIGAQAQTGIVIDDIPQPTFSTLANDLSDIQRVEVLAGPQSTLSDARGRRSHQHRYTSTQRRVGGRCKC
jgi:iron complex outermembrane receptor protein